MDAIPGMYRAFRSRLDLRSSVLDTYVCVRMHELGPNLISCFASSLSLRSRFALAFSPSLPLTFCIYPLFVDLFLSFFLFAPFSLLSLSLAPLFLVHPGRTLCTQDDTR